MDRNFTTIEDIIADERFQAWRSGSNELKAKEWELWMLNHPDQLYLQEDALTWLAAHPLKEEEVPLEQINAAYARLQNRLDSAPVIPMRRPFKWWIPAAAVIILVACGFLFFQFKR